VSDAELAARCRAGEIEAFEALYRQHAGRLFALACRLGGSADQAEDLLQEIFLQAFRKLASYKGEAALGTWLYRLAVNCCLDHLRSRRAKDWRLTDSLDVEPPIVPAAPRQSPIARIDLERAIAQLPEGCRDAFVLHDVEGFDHKEVGRLLGIAEGTSKSQVFKARLRLRALLTGNHASNGR
jgi:RNA polymerase sigma-70 factor (ECF subfamily)